MKSLIVPVDGPCTIEEVDGLPRLNEIVGGYIEAFTVNLPGKHASVVAVGYCNEEGRIHGLPMNVRASRLARQTIVGDVVLFGLPDGSGNETDVPEKLIEAAQMAGWL